MLTELELTGTSSLGPMTVKLDPARVSLGEIEELANNTPGTLDLPPFTATGTAFSFFDVFLQVEVGGQVLTAAGRRASAGHHHPQTAGAGRDVRHARGHAVDCAAGPRRVYGDGQYPLMWIVSERLTPTPWA